MQEGVGPDALEVNEIGTTPVAQRLPRRRRELSPVEGIVDQHIGRIVLGAPERRCGGPQAFVPDDTMGQARTSRSERRKAMQNKRPPAGRASVSHTYHSHSKLWDRRGASARS